MRKQQGPQHVGRSRYDRDKPSISFPREPRSFPGDKTSPTTRTGMLRNKSPPTRPTRSAARFLAPPSCLILFLVQRSTPLLIAVACDKKYGSIGKIQRRRHTAGKREQSSSHQVIFLHVAGCCTISLASLPCFGIASSANQCEQTKIGIAIGECRFPSLLTAPHDASLVDHLGDHVSPPGTRHSRSHSSK